MSSIQLLNHMASAELEPPKLFENLEIILDSM